MDRILLDHCGGVHQPRLVFEFAGDDVEAMQARVDEALNDASKESNVESAIRLSPRAARLYLEENPVGGGRINPGVLCQVRAESAAEYRTRLEYRWEPAIDFIWYNVTPFRCILTPFQGYERWMFEAHELAEEKGDYNRAYLAAKESYRCAPDNAHACVTLGWHAFRVDRVDEAIRFTNAALETGDETCEFPALINIGLFYLRAAALDQQKRESSRKSAKEFYLRAAEGMRKLEKAEAIKRAEEAITDIQRFRSLLDSDADRRLADLKSLRSELADSP
jgi:hypothetical protein